MRSGQPASGVPDLKLKRVAEDQYDALAEHIRDEIDEALLRIQANPTEEGEECYGRWTGRWRKRVSGYRIIYRIREDGHLVIVDAIKPRNAGTYR
jgi:mRNA-degrading endonuclease RelE of RelBE toxin-antitoxin system